MTTESEPEQGTSKQQNTDRHGPTRVPHSAIVRIALVYAVFASLWILLSDMILGWLISDPDLVTLISTIKGWGFVAFTSLMLYGLLRGLVSVPETLSTMPSLASVSRYGGVAFALLAVTLVALTVGTILHNLTEQRSAEGAKLRAIAHLKATQIADWLQERQADAEFLQSSLYDANLLKRWRTDDAASGQRLRQRLGHFIHSRRFSAITLLAPDGQRLWHSPMAPSELAQPLETAVKRARQEHRIERVGPYLGHAGHLRLDFVVPLSAPDPAPVAVLHSNPRDWLWTTLESWPVPSVSGETLLFWRDANQVVYLNARRHVEDGPLRIRLPLSGTEAMAAQVLRQEMSQNALLSGRDYRQVPSIGVAETIPGTNWLLLAKLDRAEVYAPAIGESVWIGLSGLLALFMAGAGLFLIRQRQQLAVTAGIQQAQAERLRALNLLAAIADGSEDAIFAKDREGHYLLFNRAASRFVGQPSEAVLGQDDHAIFPREQSEMLRTIGRRVMEENRTLSQEEVLDTALGRRVFLATKGPLRDAEGRIIGTFGVSRDITERKEAEEALGSQATELAERNRELERFNEAMVGRELDMIALKHQVNELSALLGREPPFVLDAFDEVEQGTPDDHP